MKFFRPGYWQKLILGLILVTQFLFFASLLVFVYEIMAENGPWAVLIMVGVVFILDIFLAVYIFSTSTPDVYKLSWFFLIFFLPIGGALIYIFFANKQTSRSQRRKLKKFRKPIEKFPAEEGNSPNWTSPRPPSRLTSRKEAAAASTRRPRPGISRSSTMPSPSSSKN